MSALRSAALRDLANCIPDLQGDELRVLARIAQRLVVGAGVYGVLKLETDSRDMVREASEELLDATVYLAIETIRRRPE